MLADQSQVIGSIAPSGETSALKPSEGPKYTKRDAKLRDNYKSLLDNAAGMLGMIAIARGDQALQKDSMLFFAEDKETGRTENDKLADRLTDVAKEYKQFYEWSEKFFKASPLAALIGEVAGLALAIGMNHGATLPFLSPKVQA